MRITKQQVALFLLSIILTACMDSKKEDSPKPKPQKIFTLTIDNTYPTSESENYVFVHDKAGTLIDYKPFENGQVLNFETLEDLPEKLNITLFNYINKNGYTRHNLYTYSFIATGQEWTLKEEKLPAETGQTNLGDFTINVSDVAPKHAASLTNNNGFHCNSTYNGNTNIYSANPPLHIEQEKYFLFVADELGNPKYKFLKNIKKNDTYNFSFHSMDNFDHVIDVQFPRSTQVVLITKGWEENQPLTETGYYVNNYLNYSILNNELSSLKAGYLNRFSRYLTELSVGYKDFSYFYSKRGSRPKNITLPLNAAFVFQDRSFNNFTFTHNLPFGRRLSSWACKEENINKSTYTYWNVYAPQELQKPIELPVVFTAKYPLLRLEQLKHTSSTFYTQAQSYTDFISEKFKGKALDDELEIYSVIIK